LYKQYGRRKAVDDVSMTIESGELFGLVGPNGAGKTTTMRMLVTLLKPDKGEIHVGGYSVRKTPREVRRQIGFMPDNFGVYGDLTVQEYLDFFGACYGIAPAQRASLIKDLLELVDIAHRRDDMVDTLSRGLKQRLGLARVLIHDPSVLVLDEPTAALDAETEHALFERYAAAARGGTGDRNPGAQDRDRGSGRGTNGRITLLVSHRFSTVRMADLIVVLDGARLVEIGSHEELMARKGQYSELYGIQAAAYR
jgi:ABC-type multidrug transport system ATPase subunit